ncbi:MAG: RsmE family RNA methyltransferase [Anaerovorax sp.]|nr:RsmE family RNA methyltransferase [Anaerovorax sp.]
MSRFFVDKSAVKGDFVEITDLNDIKHIIKVLRLREGSFIEVSDSAEYEYQVELNEISNECIRGKIHDKQNFSKEPTIQVSLYQGIPKQGKMETIIQKTVELGIFRIIPVFMQRTVVTEKGNFKNKLIRWQKIADEAVKQCKRGIIPQIEEPINSKDLFERVMKEHDLVLFLYENEGKTTIKQVLREKLAKKEKENASLNKIALIIGPEGGFSDEEACTFKEIGASCATLGKTILRTETAGIAALAMVMYELEL